MIRICAARMGKKAAIVMTVAIMLVLGLQKPFYNWDMIAYVAAAYNQDGLKGRDLSSATYEDIKQEVSSTDFKRLTTGNYRASVYHDPNSLEQQLPFYSIKIVYIELMRLLKQTGISYPTATYAISACFASASILLLAALCAHLSVSPLVIPLVALFSGYFSLARTSSPDALACFFALLSLYLLIKRNRLVYILVVIMPLIRTDLVVLSLLLTACIFATERNYQSLIFGFCSLIAYFGVNTIMGNYGYLVLFNFSFMGVDPYPRDMKLSVQPWEYVRAYLQCAGRLIHHRDLFLYIAVFYLLFRNGTYKKLTSALLSMIAVSCSYVLLHVALFPAYEERFVAFPLSLICIGLCATLMQGGAFHSQTWRRLTRPGTSFFLRPKDAARSH